MFFRWSELGDGRDGGRTASLVLMEGREAVKTTRKVIHYTVARSNKHKNKDQIRGSRCSVLCVDLEYYLNYQLGIML